MQLTSKDRKKIIDEATAKLTRPYKLGAKWDIYDESPQGPIDCSGFVRWCYWRGASKLIRDGSMQQYEDTVKIADKPKIGDVGFFKNGATGLIHHVGMIYSDTEMIEARGDKYNMVITRPRIKWEAWPEFTGYRRFK